MAHQLDYYCESKEGLDESRTRRLHASLRAMELAYADTPADDWCFVVARAILGSMHGVVVKFKGLPIDQCGSGWWHKATIPLTPAEAAKAYSCAIGKVNSFDPQWPIKLADLSNVVACVACDPSIRFFAVVMGSPCTTQESGDVNAAGIREITGCDECSCVDGPVFHLWWS